MRWVRRCVDGHDQVLRAQASARGEATVHHLDDLDA